MSDNPLDNLPVMGAKVNVPGFTPKPEEGSCYANARTRRATAREKLAPKPVRDAIPADVSLFVWERDGGCCLMCGRGATDKHPDGKPVKIHEGHVLPVAQGGKSVEENVCLLCDRHNLAQGAKRLRLLEVIVERHRARQEGTPVPLSDSDSPVVVDEPPPPKPERSAEDLRLLAEKNAQTEALIKKVQKPKGDKT